MGSDSSDFEQRVLATVKASLERRDPPLVWALEMGRCIQETGLEVPNTELGHVLVSNLCFSNNNPSLWKLIEQAISSRLLSPLQVLALLTSRVVPYRRSQPEAYRLYLELLTRYAFSFAPTATDMCKEKIVKSVDDALQFTHTYGICVSDVGHAAVLFLFSVIISLIDCTLEDWGLQLSSTDKHLTAYGNTDHQDMDIDALGNTNDKRCEHREHLRRMNAFMAFEVVERLTENQKAMVLLRLVHLNMPEMFNGLLQRLQFLEAHKSNSPNLKSSSQLLVRLSANVQRAMHGEYKLNKRQIIGMLIDIGSCSLASFHNFGAGQAACWLPFDIFMENAMDGRQLPGTSAIDILAELTKTLQVINRASWQETFQALWISALRLVQRERDPLEGPEPHLDARLCVLLSITPLAVVRVVDEDGEMSSARGVGTPGNVSTTYNHAVDGKGYASRRHGLVASLQILGQFNGLLLPPASVVVAANNAATKAATFISSFKNGNDSFKGAALGDNSVKAVGNMRHLIVEACIARKLLDTSAYFWAGYVTLSGMSMVDSSLVQPSPWSAFMEGSQLTDALKNALIATPASSVVELQRLYHIAINGSDEEKSAAAKILCGASLTRGWNIQEHVVHFTVKLLSPPVPSDFSGPGSHLVTYMSMLNAVLFGLSSFDIVHVLSLYGVVPEVAASLMPLCEAFGSLMPTSNHKSSANDEPSAYTVFSCAFLFLLRLWKFYRPGYDQCTVGPGGATGSALTLEYLLLLHNSRVALRNSTTTSNNAANPLDIPLVQPVYIDSFPKLRAWYSLNQACIASTLSGLCNGNPVHQVANKIVSMIYWKMTKSGALSGNSTPSSGNLSGSPVNSGDEAYQRPVLPAWEVLEATPFVLEALLTACAHGRLSSRDLTTGLRDLVDFLPASLAAIISYFSAEITRGIWKPVSMNGTDWPSPAANLLLIESEIQEVLASAGVNVPSFKPGSPVMLPLPMAAMVSLTITFKLDKSLEYIHGVAGPALENCASACPWPCMPIISALWAQKVRRWHNFIVVSCCRSVIRQDQEAIAQLLRSCFATFLEPLHVSATPGGVTGLLGNSVASHGGRIRLTPGFLYLRTCRTTHNVHFVNDVILEQVAESARMSAIGWTHAGSARLKSGKASLATAAAWAKEVAVLGASLLCASGGGQLVRILYTETMPTWLISFREQKVGVAAGPASCIMEGYALAYLLFISGTFAWGIGSTSVVPLASSRRTRVVGIHMDFMARALEGNVSLGCDPATWKAYVSSFVGLVVTYAPAWIPELKQETLRKLANGLRGWHECELALALLERGGEAAIGYIAELFL